MAPTPSVPEQANSESLDVCIEGNTVMGIVLTHRIVTLYELSLQKCIEFVASLNIEEMSTDVKCVMFHSLMTATMEEAESLLEYLGVKDFEELGDDEAEEDEDWVPSE
jgi:hypothetical protein